MERPLVIHFSTTSLDGRIASSSMYSSLSCIFDKTRLYIIRGSVNAVVVGARTVEVDDPRLVKRIGGAKPYYRVVVDGKLRLTPGYRVFNVEEAPTILVTSRDAPRDKLYAFRSRGVEVLLAGRGGRVDIREMLEVLLHSYGVKSVLLEGGGVLAWSFHRERLVDELRVTYAPVIFAAGRAVIEDPAGVGFPDWKSSPRLELVCSEVCPCGNCVHVVYRVKDARGVPVGRAPEACVSEKLVRIVSGVIQSRAPT